MKKRMFRKTFVVIVITSFLIIASYLAPAFERLKTAEKINIFKSPFLNLDDSNFLELSEIFSDYGNVVNFGRIVGTKKVNWFIFFSDSYVLEKHINITSWNPDCDQWYIKISTEPFNWRVIRYILYTVKIRINDISCQKDILAGSKGVKFCFPVILEDIEQGDMINVSIEVKGGLIHPLIRVPFYLDFNPMNNKGVCSFSIES